MRAFMISLLIGLTLLSRYATPAAAQPVTNVETGDPAMASAMAKARKSLPDFWVAYEKAGAAGADADTSDFSIKVGLPTVSGSRTSVEHIWVHSIERLAAGRLRAILGNDPGDLGEAKLGDIIEFDEKQISDWMFMRAGKMVGNETLRALFARMPKEQVEALKQMLEKP